MKLLHVLVTTIAVFTVAGRDFSNEPEVRDTASEVQLSSEEFEEQKKENNLLVPGEFQDQDFSDVAKQPKKTNLIFTEEKKQHQEKIRRSRCKARNACVVMGGFCVTNVTLCSGRLVPEGCKGTGCQCCVPRTIEDKFDNLEEELLSFKENMSNSNSNLNSDLQSLRNNFNHSKSDLNSELLSIIFAMNNSNSNLHSELQSLKVNTNIMNSNINSKLNSMNTNLNSKLDSLAEKIAACPVGFFKVPSSVKQCFRYFNDSARSWDTSKTKCQSEGLVLAKPNNPLVLRRYLYNTYGASYAWIGARGTGSTVKWDRDGTTIATSNSLWYHGHHYKPTSNYCLVILANTAMNDKPNQPYNMNSCSSTASTRYALCELL